MCYTCGCKLSYEAHAIRTTSSKTTSRGPARPKAGIKAAKENMFELIQLQKEAVELEAPRKDYNEAADR